MNCTHPKLTPTVKEISTCADCGDVIDKDAYRLAAFEQAARDFLDSWDSGGNLDVNRAVAAKDALRALVEGS